MDAIPELRMERRGSDRETLSIPVRPPKHQQSELKDIFEYMDAKSWTRIDGRDPDAMLGEMRLRPRASQHPGAPPYKPTLRIEGHFEKMDTIDGGDPGAAHRETRLRPGASQHPGAPP